MSLDMVQYDRGFCACQTQSSYRDPFVEEAPGIILYIVTYSKYLYVGISIMYFFHVHVLFLLGVPWNLEVRVM